ncbi:MAG: fumarylacetoacetate hydrolase family protein [Bacteroidales bacterium]|nr:fumarylacetoacetate hydrolase family protein [Muribaculaceae bacterium]MDO4970749.1 fumarylacetoacetate hydrolase family protein [Bacteroidales bacterium]
MKIIVIKGNGTQRSYHLMADSSMLVNNKPFFVPDFAPEFVMHAALAVRVDRLGKNIAPRFAHRYYQSVAACAVVEAKGIECDALDARYSAFDGAFMLGNAIALADVDSTKGFKVEAFANENEADSTALLTAQHIDALVAEASKYFTLKMGDMIVVGSDTTGHKLNIGEHLSATVNKADSLKMRIK